MDSDKRREKEKQEKIRDEEKRETPIIDGDARPDMALDPDKDDLKRTGQSATEKKFEAERHGDVNSLEDYKDAKK